MPRDLAANLKFRKGVILRAVNNPLFQQGLIEACRRDPVFWLSTFGWQHNPKDKRAPNGPFIAFKFQEKVFLDLIQSILDGEDLTLEKSRELGATWLVLFAFVWCCLFKSHLDFLCLSKTEADAESDSPNSHFWKIRYILDRVPRWMTGPKKDRKGFLGFDRTRCTISAFAPTAAAGVGGRFRAIFLDEFQKMTNASEIRMYSSDISDCRIFVGTHIGVDTEFYKLCNEEGVHKLVLHWSMHPEKGAGLYKVDHATGQVTILDKQFDFPADFRPVVNGKPGGPFSGIRSPWYDKQTRRRSSDRDVAMNLDIDPRGATDKFFDTLKIEEYKRQHCRPPLWRGEIRFVDGKPRLMQDPKGSVKLWINPRHDDSFPPASYGFGGDISQGVGATPSTASGVNLTTGEKIFEFSSAHILPKDFADFMVNVCNLFADDHGSPAMFNWEVNGPGSVIIGRLRELGFTSIYFREVDWRGATAKEPGFRTTPVSKLQLLSEYRDGILSSRLINPSLDAMEECHSYKYSDNGMVEHGATTAKTTMGSGARENHGDLVIADALAWWMARHRVVSEQAPVKKDPINPMSARGRMERARKSTLDSWYPTA